MKKINLKRDILVPDTGYCLMWKNQVEICPKLTFGKVAGKPDIAWQCTFFDKDIKQNIDSFGIKKYCDDIVEKGTIHNILDNSKII